MGLGIAESEAAAVGELVDGESLAGGLGAVMSVGVDGAQLLTKTTIATPIKRLLGVSTPSP